MATYIDEEKLIDYLEKIMITIEPKNRRCYMAGIIDSQADFGNISEEMRARLYLDYAE